MVVVAAGSSPAGAAAVVVGAAVVVVAGAAAVVVVVVSPPPSSLPQATASNDMARIRTLSLRIVFCLLRWARICSIPYTMRPRSPKSGFFIMTPPCDISAAPRPALDGAPLGGFPL